MYIDVLLVAVATSNTSIYISEKRSSHDDTAHCPLWVLEIADNP